jgi:hypothetical protein
VAAVEVLHERMSGTDNACRAESFKPRIGGFYGHLALGRAARTGAGERHGVAKLQVSAPMGNLRWGSGSLVQQRRGVRRLSCTVIFRTPAVAQRGHPRTG